jgi:transmembrane sensor
MITEQSEARLRAEIADQAADWFVELAEAELDTRAREAFIRWLQTSPAHAFAYLQVAALWEDAPLLDVRERRNRDELIALAKGEANVVPLGVMAGQITIATPTQAIVRQPRAGAVVVLAASVLVAVAGGTLVWHQLLNVPTYSTDIGEQRLIRLADGSTLELNARSNVRIHYSESERGVELSEGQLLARVARDAKRPFVVRSGDAEVRAVGTVFDVYRKASGTTVTVVEGTVAVALPRRAIRPRLEGGAPAVTSTSVPLMLQAGEQIRVTPSAPAEPIKADIAAAIGWTHRQLVFQRATLTEVVEEFNRYNPRPMVIKDAALADARIGGVFSSTDPTSLLLFVRSLPDVNVEETESEVRINRK